MKALESVVANCKTDVLHYKRTVSNLEKLSESIALELTLHNRNRDVNHLTIKKLEDELEYYHIWLSYYRRYVKFHEEYLLEIDVRLPDTDDLRYQQWLYSNQPFVVRKNVRYFKST